MWGFSQCLIIIFIQIKRSESEVDCQEKSYECNTMLSVSDHNFGMVTSDFDLDRMCSAVKSAMKCTQEYYESDCVNSESRQNFTESSYSSAVFANELCTNNSETRIEYLKHSRCLKEISEHHCHDYNETMQTMINTYVLMPYTTEEDYNHNETTLSPQQICCSYNNFLACAKNSKHELKSVCFDNSYDSIEKILISTMPLHLRNYCVELVWKRPEDWNCVPAPDTSLHWYLLYILIPVVLFSLLAVAYRFVPFKLY